MNPAIETFRTGGAPDTHVDACGRRHPQAGGDARIVSLVPSLTELICDLGLGAQLVGRTGFCIHPRETLRTVPKVGGTKDVKVDVLRALEPSHLIVNVDENRRETVEELAAFVPNVIVTHPCAPADNLGLYRLFGGVFGREREAEALCAALQSALDEAAALRAQLAGEAVLYLIWRQPWMTVSRETYISAMLDTVGWRTLPEGTGPRYPAFDWALAARAERVFLSSEPYHFNASHLSEVESLGGRPAALIDGEMVSWYGSRAVAGLRYLLGLRRELAGLAAA
ncbi:helical backbone metal receptor [Thauera linaloolentis]|uniref:Iron hydroxamate ABC transporter periplasmic protein n=1 Tax=Thauera linaloolentis (strain DSM 12138 / JCM 21573 / CCUG 41526 / CIP 105981 / IAM 15112 / NBRC 102519 / 47Lol) TaxID=1123367 RepID=N6Z1F8_THAL4|nr:helical backbone metal receptor [Thauera linaloolentis]ENO88248.1 iron hydroxamate ABC transporter periplasmic protein [Thauera linaloolentis 47Lol = DSM 12138]MCM8566835.1 helical backbone metal receptor [Thauera linaloolentis]